jgi:hypothetical protein
MTNPPYLGSGQHGAVLKNFCEKYYTAAKSDLANVFLERCLKLCTHGGVVSFVMPQNWTFLKTYSDHRSNLVRTKSIAFLSRLGPGAFESISGEVVKAILLTVINTTPNENQRLSFIEASHEVGPLNKTHRLQRGDVHFILQNRLMRTNQSPFNLSGNESSQLIRNSARSFAGMDSGDSMRFRRFFWELPRLSNGWIYQLTSPTKTSSYEGRSQIVFFENGVGDLSRCPGSSVGNVTQWGKPGVAVARMNNLPSTLSLGESWNRNCVMLIPKNQDDLPALWAYCQSGDFEPAVREVNQKLSVAESAFEEVEFDKPYWQNVAAKLYPKGLPKPYSDDPTQWIFHGHPQPSTNPLQVALARLLGYRWPAESDGKMELSGEARAWIARCKELDALVDDDGILCLPAVRGEASAVERLRAVLAKAFGKDWSAVREAQLLKDAGSEGIPLAQWLRDKFFEQHVICFQKRPFIWHVWDGHKDGFSALLNYHTLTRAKLQTLIHTYLGDWMTQQRRAVDAGGTQSGEATIKLAKAEALKVQLEAIAHGEQPFDIFVRWKLLSQQPMSWDPDLNDGVRMNIRSFVQAGVLRINQSKLGIKWESDRGKDLASAPWFKLGPTYGEPEGTRINKHHLSLAEKQAARTMKR